jgi:predicted DNA-binding protein
MNAKKIEPKIVPIRLDPETHKNLRKLAYLTEVPMAEIIRQGIKIKIEENKKMLTNSDVAI